MSLKQEVVIRPLMNFPPSVWGDQFLVYDQQEEQDEIKQRVKDLKEEIKTILNVQTDNSNLIKLIDAIQRLGIAYYFEEEINQALQLIYDTYGDKWVGSNTSIWFRILREHGYYVSCDVFNSYKNNEGGFKESLSNDAQALLDLYEATYLRVEGEDILEDALIFTRTRLAEIANDTFLSNSNMSAHIQIALKQPLRKRWESLEALSYIPFYQQEASHNESLLELAKLGFNLLQSQHKMELAVLSRWWKRYDVPNNLSYARDRLVEVFLWAVGMHFEPQYSRSRIFATKYLAVGTILDDTYDAYGTYEELQIFTEAIERWSITCMDILPPKLRVAYQMVMDMYDELEEILEKEGRSSSLYYFKETMKEYIRSYITEAKWAHEGYIPTVEEHKAVTYISCGYKVAIVSSFAALEHINSDNLVKWAFTYPPLMEASCATCRIMDDMVTHKEERERYHVVSSIECSMKQFDVTEKDAHDLSNKKVEDAWKKMTYESLTIKDFPVAITNKVISLARGMEIFYKNGNYFSYVGEEQINVIKSILVDPVST